MRPFSQLDGRLEGDRRLHICRVRVGLNVDRQSRIRQLISDTLYVAIVPNFKPCSVFRQRVSNSAESWFGLPQPYLPRENHQAWLIVLTPVSWRGVALSRNPAPINQDSCPAEKKWSPQMISVLVAVILVPQGDLILEVIFASDLHRPPFHARNRISYFLIQIQR